MQSKSNTKLDKDDIDTMELLYECQYILLQKAKKH